MSKSKSSHIKVSRSCISEKASMLPPSGIRKFFDLLSSIEGVISLGVGEPDFVTPWHICEAAIYSMEKGYTMYTSNKGTPELRAELARHLESRFGLTYNPEDEILITVGVSEGLDLAMRAIINPGDEVIMPDPCYVAYPAAVSLAGGTPVLVPTTEENNFEIAADDIEPRITQKTKAILIGYPCNPTGAVLSKEELTQIAELAKRYNLLWSRTYLSRYTAGYERAYHSAERLFQSLCHDRMANRLCCRQWGNYRSHDQDSPIHHAMRFDNGTNGSA
jgi:aminotransferase